MDKDRPVLGIALMLGFCLLAPFADALAKAIGSAVPLLQVVAVRFVGQAILLVPAMLVARRPVPRDRDLWARLVLRTLLHIAGIALIFLALRAMPLADTIAIAYVMPFIVLLLGHLLLAETVGWRRLAACAVGFAGTILVMQPSFADVGWVVTLPLIVALLFALFMLLTRSIARRIDPIDLQAVNGLMGSLLLVPLLVLFDGSGLAEADPIWPAPREAMLLAAIAVCGTGAHLLLTWALRYAPTATLAPIQYLEIPVAVLFGYLLFAEFPNGLALAGIAVVMVAGLYLVWRESVTARAHASPQPVPPAAE